MSHALQSRFTYWQLVLAGAHYGAATWVLQETKVEGWPVPTVLRFNVWSSSEGGACGENGCTINEYEYQLPFALQTGLLVSSFSFISGTHHALAALGGPKYICHLVRQRGVSVLRWLDYCWSASLMLMLDSVLWVAPASVQTLVLTFCVMWLVIVAGYGSEVAWSEGRVFDAGFIYALAVAPFVCVFGVTWAVFLVGLSPPTQSYLLRSASLTPSLNLLRDDANNKPPDFVYAIVGWIAFTYALFPLAALWRMIYQTSPVSARDVVVAESVYSVLSFVAKIPLLVVYGTAVAARTNRISVGVLQPDLSDIEDMDSSAFRNLGIAGGTSFLLGLVLMGTIVFSSDKK